MVDFAWTEERVEALIAMKKEGRSASEIAAALGCASRSCVCGKVMRLRDAGRLDGPRTFQTVGSYAPAARGRKSPGLAHVPLIKARLDEGRNDREIADEIGVKPDDVRYVRRIKGFVAKVAPGRPAPKFADNVTRLVRDGKNDREIAQELGITIWQARGERRRQNLQAPASPPPRPARVTTITKGDPGARIAEVFAEGFMGQRSRVDLVGLELGLCRFPIDQLQGPPRYCGDQAAEGRAYCAHHAARCYTPVVPMKPLQRNCLSAGRR